VGGPDPSAPAAGGNRRPACADLARLRGDDATRASGFLLLPSPAGLPVVCAFSRDAGGRGLVLGLKAASDPGRAAAGAMIEMLQMEIALEMARLRAARGQAAPGDAGPLGRAALDPDAFPAFAALPPDGAPSPAPRDAEALAAHLAACGLPVTLADLGRPAGGLAVAKAFVPGLLPLPGPGPDPAPDAPGAFAEAL
jgi:ribosomal protein S12 methylthiotransferase accessory factor